MVRHGKVQCCGSQQPKKVGNPNLALLSNSAPAHNMIMQAASAFHRPSTATHHLLCNKLRSAHSPASCKRNHGTQLPYHGGASCSKTFHCNLYLERLPTYSTKLHRFATPMKQPLLRTCVLQLLRTVVAACLQLFCVCTRHDWTPDGHIAAREEP